MQFFESPQFVQIIIIDPQPFQVEIRRQIDNFLDFIVGSIKYL